MRSEAGWIISGGLLARQLLTHLHGYVGQGGGGDPSHAVDTSIARSCRFHLFLYRTGRGKDVLERLHTAESIKEEEEKCMRTQTRIRLLNSPSQGSWGSYSWSAYTSIGH